ncbi:MAG TPA: alpha/beta hydrolase [Verrucomicrobiae bacterium]|nr:alpha/beta hydrolase [Verrucomicrobiae bacterium]
MLGFLLGLAIVYLGVLALLYFYQQKLLYFPDVERPDAGPPGLLEPVAYRSADGIELNSLYRAPPSDAAQVLLHFHGNAGNIGDRVGRIVPYADAGMGVLLAEYRGFGGNSGSPSEQGFYDDARAAIGFLRQQGVEPGRIVFYGESLGSGVAVQMATEFACGALVLEAPYSSVADVAQGRYWMFPVKALVRDRFDSTAKIAGVRCPIFIMHGTADRVIPIRYGERLYTLAPSPKEMKVYPGLGHVQFDEVRGFDAVLDFLRRHGMIGAVRDHLRQDAAG